MFEAGIEAGVFLKILEYDPDLSQMHSLLALARPLPHKKFHKDLFFTFVVILNTDKHTNK